MYASKFEFWNFEILGFIFVKWTRYKIGVDALTQSARGRWPRAIFWQSHRAPMPLSKFFSMQQAAPMSLMRGLCWNHRFRPSCACVLPLVRDAGPLLEPLVPPLVRLRAPGFIPDLFWIYSHPSPFQEERQEYCEKCVRNGNRIYGGFMSDLFTFWALPGGAPEKKGCNKSDPPFGLGPNGGSDLWPPN